MKKYTLSKIIDFIFKTILLFVLFFVWIRFYVPSLTNTLIYSIIGTFMLSIILHQIKMSRFEKEYFSKAEFSKLESFTNEFLFSSQKNNNEFFLKLLQTKHHSVLIQSFIIVNKENNQIALYPYYKTRKLTMDDAKNLSIEAKELKIKKLIICCKSCEQEVLNFSKQLTSLKLIVLDQKQTYFKLLKPYNCYPELKNKLIEENKITLSQLLNVMFQKRRTKGYFVSGTILMFTSFLVPYNLYYVIFGSILYFMALFSYFNVPFNKKLSENMLEEETT